MNHALGVQFYANIRYYYPRRSTGPAPRNSIFLNSSSEKTGCSRKPTSSVYSVPSMSPSLFSVRRAFSVFEGFLLTLAPWCYFCSHASPNDRVVALLHPPPTCRLRRLPYTVICLPTTRPLIIRGTRWPSCQVIRILFDRHRLYGPPPYTGIHILPIFLARPLPSFSGSNPPLRPLGTVVPLRSQDRLLGMHTRAAELPHFNWPSSLLDYITCYPTADIARYLTPSCTRPLRLLCG